MPRARARAGREGSRRPLVPVRSQGAAAVGKGGPGPRYTEPHEILGDAAALAREGSAKASLRCAKLVVMSLTLHVPEELAERLAAEASRRGLSVDQLSAQLLAAGLPKEDALEAFIGCGSSGSHEPFEIHAARSELARRKLAQGA